MKQHILAETYDSPSLHLPAVLLSFDHESAVDLALKFIAIETLDPIYSEVM